MRTYIPRDSRCPQEQALVGQQFPVVQKNVLQTHQTTTVAQE
jgi:hypothetical protein